jgi:hypothetical protein
MRCEPGSPTKDNQENSPMTKIERSRRPTIADFDFVFGDEVLRGNTMIGDSREAFVTMDGQTCKLRVKRSKNSAWIAYGEFKGRIFEGQGTTAGSAVLDWRKNVESRQKKSLIMRFAGVHKNSIRRC